MGAYEHFCLVIRRGDYAGPGGLLRLKLLCDEWVASGDLSKWEQEQIMAEWEKQTIAGAQMGLTDPSPELLKPTAAVTHRQFHGRI